MNRYLAEFRSIVAQACPPRAYVYGSAAFVVIVATMAQLSPPLAWTCTLLVWTVGLAGYADSRANYRRQALAWRSHATANARAHAEALINEAAALEGCAAYRRRVEHLERVVATSVLTPESRKLIAEGCQ